LEKIKLGVSSCLFGEMVGYACGHKLDQFLSDTLAHYVEWVPVQCEPMRFEAGHENPGTVSGFPRFLVLSEVIL
jgi:uncharacterized protein YbbK (DUF523 family)